MKKQIKWVDYEYRAVYEHQGWKWDGQTQKNVWTSIRPLQGMSSWLYRMTKNESKD